MDLIADTTLLVGLWRGQGWAQAFARANSRRILGVPWVVLGEFQHGARRAGHDPVKVADFLALGLPLVDPVPVVPVYAEVCARLQTVDPAAYRGISQNDLWIAAAAIAFAKPLVSRNRRHFACIEGLRLEIPPGA